MWNGRTTHADIVTTAPSSQYYDLNEFIGFIVPFFMMQNAVFAPFTCGIIYSRAEIEWIIIRIDSVSKSQIEMKLF